MRIVLLTILLSLALNYALPFFFLPETTPNWKRGDMQGVGFLVSGLLASVIAFSVAGWSKTYSVSRYHVPLLRGSKCVEALLVLVLSGLVIYTYMKFGNSLRSMDQGQKGGAGALAYLSYVGVHLLFLHSLLINRKHLQLVCIPLLFMTANGTFGYLLCALAVCFVIVERFYLSKTLLIWIAPFLGVLVLAGVFYSKAKSIEALVILMQSDYVYELGWRLGERVNLFNLIASYQLESPHQCRSLDLLFSEYESGLTKIGLINADATDTFSKCTYRHFADHSLNFNSGASIGLVASLVDLQSIFFLIVLLPLILVLCQIFDEILRRQYGVDSAGYLCSIMAISLYFLPMLDSPVGSFVIFQVNGLKLILICSYIFFILKLQRRRSYVCNY